jgi:hypothetical protein
MTSSITILRAAGPLFFANVFDRERGHNFFNNVFESGGYALFFEV